MWNDGVNQYRSQVMQRVVRQITRRNGAMKSNQACPCMNGKVQCGYIAVANKRFGVFSDQSIVQQGEQAAGAVASPDTPNSVNSGVLKCPMQVGQAGVIAASQVTVFGPEVFPFYDLKTKPAEIGNGFG